MEKMLPLFGYHYIFKNLKMYANSYRYCATLQLYWSVLAEYVMGSRLCIQLVVPQAYENCFIFYLVLIKLSYCVAHATTFTCNIDLFASIFHCSIKYPFCSFLTDIPERNSIMASSLYLAYLMPQWMNKCMHNNVI